MIRLALNCEFIFPKVLPLNKSFNFLRLALKDQLHKQTLEKDTKIVKLQGDCEQLNDFLQEVSKENDQHQAEVERLKAELQEQSQALFNRSTEASATQMEVQRLRQCQEELAVATQDLETALGKVHIFFLIFFFFP